MFGFLFVKLERVLVARDAMPPPLIDVQIIRAGDGKYYPKPGETVAIHYTIKLASGKEVDNTYKRKQPFRFKVACGQVVKGWDAAVTQLSVGEESDVRVPGAAGVRRERVSGFDTEERGASRHARARRDIDGGLRMIENSEGELTRSVAIAVQEDAAR